MLDKLHSLILRPAPDLGAAQTALKPITAVNRTAKTSVGGLMPHAPVGHRAGAGLRDHGYSLRLTEVNDKPKAKANPN